MDDAVFIDSTEFQKKVLEYITSEEFNKMFNNTVFQNDKQYKSAMIHGMAVATMLTVRCHQYYQSKTDDTNDCKSDLMEVIHSLAWRVAQCQYPNAYDFNEETLENIMVDAGLSRKYLEE